MDIINEAYEEGIINWNIYIKAMKKIRTNLNGSWMFEQKSIVEKAEKEKAHEIANLDEAAVKRIISTFLKTNVTQIADWKDFEGTNFVYFFRVNGEKYVVRWFEHTNTRQIKAEKAAYSALQSLGISDEVLYFDKDGVKIARYLDGEQLKNTSDDDLADAITRLRGIHQSGRTIPSRYNIFSMIADYCAKLRSINPAKAEALRGYQKDIDAIKAAFDAMNVTPVLCQGDPCAGNFLRLKDGSLHLIDWEQAVMADPFHDLAVAALNQEFDKARIEWCLKQYLNRDPNEPETYRMHACTALAGFMLSASVPDVNCDADFYFDKAVEACGICAGIRVFGDEKDKAVC
jgi:thiamine kinase-like enzyme